MRFITTCSHQWTYLLVPPTELFKIYTFPIYLLGSSIIENSNTIHTIDGHQTTEHLQSTLDTPDVSQMVTSAGNADQAELQEHEVILNGEIYRVTEVDGQQVLLNQAGHRVIPIQVRKILLECSTSVKLVELTTRIDLSSLD